MVDIQQLINSAAGKNRPRGDDNLKSITVSGQLRTLLPDLPEKVFTVKEMQPNPGLQVEEKSVPEMAAMLHLNPTGSDSSLLATLSSYVDGLGFGLKSGSGFKTSKKSWARALIPGITLDDWAKRRAFLKHPIVKFIHNWNRFHVSSRNARRWSGKSEKSKMNKLMNRRADVTATDRLKRIVKQGYTAEDAAKANARIKQKYAKIEKRIEKNYEAKVNIIGALGNIKGEFNYATTGKRNFAQMNMEGSGGSGEVVRVQQNPQQNAQQQGGMNLEPQQQQQQQAVSQRNS